MYKTILLQNEYANKIISQSFKILCFQINDVKKCEDINYLLKKWNIVKCNRAYQFIYNYKNIAHTIIYVGPINRIKSCMNQNIHIQEFENLKNFKYLGDYDTMTHIIKESTYMKEKYIKYIINCEEDKCTIYINNINGESKYERLCFTWIKIDENINLENILVLDINIMVRYSNKGSYTKYTIHDKENEKHGAYLIFCCKY
jgi:hypothetical protein